MKLPKFNLCYNTRGLIKAFVESNSDRKHENEIHQHTNYILDSEIVASFGNRHQISP